MCLCTHIVHKCVYMTCVHVTVSVWLLEDRFAECVHDACVRVQACACHSKCLAIRGQVRRVDYLTGSLVSAVCAMLHSTDLLTLEPSGSSIAASHFAMCVQITDASPAPSFIQVLGIRLRLSGLDNKHFGSLIHLVSSSG